MPAPARSGCPTPASISEHPEWEELADTLKHHVSLMALLEQVDTDLDPVDAETLGLGCIAAGQVVVPRQGVVGSPARESGAPPCESTETIRRTSQRETQESCGTSQRRNDGPGNPHRIGSRNRPR